MAFLSILRTVEDRCEQCDSTEHVLNVIVSQEDTDTIRLTACVVCLIVAMDNAMEWNMSRTFAQALANRQAGAQVHELQRKERESLDERIRSAEERGRFALSDSAERGPRPPVRTDSGSESERGKGTSGSTERGGGTLGGKRRKDSQTT